MLSWIVTPGSASVHADLMSEQVPDATTSAKIRYSLERQGLGKAVLYDLNSELKKAGIMGARWLHCGCDLHLGPKA